MSAKIYDKFLLFISLIAISPLVIAALIAVAIGYPLHLITSSFFAKNKKKEAKGETWRCQV